MPLSQTLEPRLALTTSMERDWSDWSDRQASLSQFTLALPYWCWLCELGLCSPAQRAADVVEEEKSQIFRQKTSLQNIRCRLKTRVS